MGKFSIGTIVLILLIVLLMFGGKKIPELMRGLGQGMKEFKDASSKDDKKGDKKDDKKTEEINDKA
ncbi:MAG: sec-independent protein translocase protein TatA [Parvicella sp.]|jgi:sec-independent protein translocase protein TatA